MTAAAPVVDWAVATRALSGESVSGDLHLVAPFPYGALAGVVDGLGHGPDAALAAAAAVELLTREAGAPVSALMASCHAALRGTRGVVMSLASFDAATDTLSWIGVGDVEGVLIRADPHNGPRDSIVLRGGVVGYQLPPLRERSSKIHPGDVLILTTDGVRPHFLVEAVNERQPREIADGVLAAYAKPTDDALVLVVRYRGDRP